MHYLKICLRILIEIEKKAARNILIALISRILKDHINLYKQSLCKMQTFKTPIIKGL